MSSGIAASSASCWLRNGRCLGALGDSLLGPLVPSWLAGCGGELPAGGTNLSGDGVALGDDRASWLFGDELPAGVTQLVVGAVA
jgi:hypothetical protein